MAKTPELHNPIAQWIEPGLESWKQVGAEVSFLKTQAYKIPRIYYRGLGNENILLAGAFHDEETSGAKTILDPANFDLVRKAGFSILAYPIINFWGLRFCLLENERWHRKGPEYVNYNDGWGKSIPGKNVEVSAIQRDIGLFMKKNRIVCAIAMHEASDNPGVGFLYSLNARIEITDKIFSGLVNTTSGRYLAEFTQGSSVQTEFGGNIRHGCIIADSKDPHSFEDWISSGANRTPVFVVEAPFGESLEHRERFQATSVRIIVTSLC